MKVIFYLIVSLMLLVNFNQRSHAQNENLHFEHIGFEEGLLNENITAILQDSIGYLWFGTADGLYKYDGYSFTKYQLDPFDPNSLSQNLIYTLYEDKNGSIWMATYEGLCRFDRKSEKFTRYKPPPHSKCSDPNISAINEDSDGMMWVGNHSGGLCRFNPQTGQFFNERFDLGFHKLHGDQADLHDGVTSIYKDRSGVLWVGNLSGLHRINLKPTKPGQLSRVSITHYQYDANNPNSLSSNNVSSIIEDRAGVMWVATDKGLNSFDRKTGIFKRYQHDSKNKHSISSNNLNLWYKGGIKEDHEGNLWISTTNGLNKLNKERTQFTAYFHQPRNLNSISSSSIAVIEIDSSNVLWASTWFGKLNKANLNNKAFQLIRHDPENKNSLSNNQVTAILEDTAGMVWIGTYGGGLNRWDKKKNEWKHFKHNPANPRSLRYDTILALFKDRHGHLWVGNGEMLSLLNNQTGAFTHYNSNAANYREEDFRVIYSICEDRQGLLWLGTGNGIKSFDEKTGRFVHYYYNKEDTTGISDYTAIAVFADSRDHIWVGHGSIATDKLDKRTGRFTRYKHNPQDSTSISSNIVQCMFQDAKGNLWIGTAAGGLCYFDYQKQKFSIFTEKHGLSGNTVFSIVADHQKQLWLGTNNGLSRFDPATKTFTNYNYKDGLQGNIFAAGRRNRGAGFKGMDGTLYFGGSKGFNFFHPEELKVKSPEAPIVITQFKLFDKLIKGIPEKKAIRLKHNQNYFSFEFSSLSFYNPAKNQYAYQLEGFDKDWVYSGSRRYAGYTNIEPGRYIFKVKGTNNDGIWNEKGTYMTIIINPPWWRTWWAYGFYGLCFIAGVFAVDRFQRRRLIQREREKSRDRELQQAREIEKAYHQLKTTQAQLVQREKMASLGELAAGIAHEIQNPLNFVNNFSEINKELIAEMKQEMDSGDLKDATAIANDIEDNEEKIRFHGKRADAIVKSMLQHSRSASGEKQPTDINALADEYLRLSYHGQRAKDKTFNATLQTNFDESISKVNVVPQDISRVLLNLFNNAFYSVAEKKKQQPSDYNPLITVSTKNQDDTIEISVYDNGLGIPKKVVDKIYQPFFTTKPTGQGTGLGLSLSYDIITKEHDGELKVETKEGEYAEFIIRLPAQE